MVELHPEAQTTWTSNPERSMYVHPYGRRRCVFNFMNPERSMYNHTAFGIESGVVDFNNDGRRRFHCWLGVRFLTYGHENGAGGGEQIELAMFSSSASHKKSCIVQCLCTANSTVELIRLCDAFHIQANGAAYPSAGDADRDSHFAYISSALSKCFSAPHVSPRSCHKTKKA